MSDCSSALYRLGNGVSGNIDFSTAYLGTVQQSLWDSVGIIFPDNNSFIIPTPGSYLIEYNYLSGSNRTDWVTPQLDTSPLATGLAIFAGQTASFSYINFGTNVDSGDTYRLAVNITLSTTFTFIGGVQTAGNIDTAELFVNRIPYGETSVSRPMISVVQEDLDDDNLIAVLESDSDDDLSIVSAP